MSDTLRLAYIISAYKNPAQLTRLIRRLSAGQTTFFVHVDKKTSVRVFRRMFDDVRSLPNVHFLERHVINWGDFGHVRATLKGVNEIIRQGISFDFVVLLTGQDYPIKSNAHIGSTLNASRGKAFLKFFPLPSNEWANGGMNRIERWHFGFKGWHYLFPANPERVALLSRKLATLSAKIIPFKRPFPRGYQAFGGSSYWCLPTECVLYIHEFIHRNPGFVDFFRHVYISDEIFFHTIILNSPFKEHVVNDDLRYVDWSKPAGPAVLTIEDFPKLLHSRKLFARKFDVTVDERVLDMIDHVLLGERPEPYGCG
jgi:hypothetical protein